MDMNVRHKIEEAAIYLEKQEAHFRNWTGTPYPWTDTKVASAFGRAAKILRKALSDGS